MKFYNYYTSINWKIGGRIQIEDWHSMAKNWILKSEEIKTFIPGTRNEDNLKTNQNKDYDEPL